MPTFKPEIRRAVYDKCKGRCAYCGCELLIHEMQVDHVVPQRAFAMKLVAALDTGVTKNHISNLLPACRSCNFAKHDHSLEVFRSEMEKQLERLQDTFNYKMAKKFGQVKETPAPIVFWFEAVNIHK